MFLGITNTPRDYAWGSRSAIAELLGRQPSGRPEAELWLGDHPASPSRTADGRGLDEVIRHDPAAVLGQGRPRLPFLMKVLAADAPLSLQAHPNAAQAQAGFRREEQAGVAIDAAERNYKDPSAKPELILAVSPTFEALAGFRHVSESRMLLAELTLYAASEDRGTLAAFGERLALADPGEAASTGSSADVNRTGMPDDGVTEPQHEGAGNPLKRAVAWLLDGGPEVDRLVAAVVAAAPNGLQRSSFQREFQTVADLADFYPGDPGIVLSLLLNRVSLAQGQALALPAGNLHAYLQGVGIEVMAASDNTLRGGLTPKHVDRRELLDVVVFEALPTPVVRPETVAPGITAWRGDTDDFVLAQVTLGEAGYTHGYQLTGPDTAAFTLTGPAIALAVSGGVTIRGAQGSSTVARGDAVYVSPDEGELTFSGSGSVFVATTP